MAVTRATPVYDSPISVGYVAGIPYQRTSTGAILVGGSVAAHRGTDVVSNTISRVTTARTKAAVATVRKANPPIPKPSAVVKPAVKPAVAAPKPAAKPAAAPSGVAHPTISPAQYLAGPVAGPIKPTIGKADYTRAIEVGVLALGAFLVLVLLLRGKRRR